MPLNLPCHLVRLGIDGAGDAARVSAVGMSRAARGVCRLILALLLGALAACSVPPGVGPGSSPLDPRTAVQPSPDALSPAALLSEAQAAWALLQGRGRIADEAAQVRATALLSRLLQAASVIDPQIAGWRGTVALVAGESPDAWCLPEGRCALTRAMAVAGDEQIVVALAHELAHLLRDHPRERLVLGRPGLVPGVAVRKSVAPGVAAVSGVASGRTDQVGASGSLASEREADPWLTQPYHRVHEAEADRLAVELLARAGFDPRLALQFWRALSSAPLPGATSPTRRQSADAPAGGSVSFLTRHPAPPSRMRDLDIYADRMRPFFLGLEP